MVKLECGIFTTRKFWLCEFTFLTRAFFQFLFRLPEDLAPGSIDSAIRVDSVSTDRNLFCGPRCNFLARDVAERMMPHAGNHP